MKAKELAITLVLMISMMFIFKVFQDEFEGLFRVFIEALINPYRVYFY